jgi:hypothetical protein
LGEHFRATFVCALAAVSVLEGMLAQYKIERKLRKENRDG